MVYNEPLDVRAPVVPYNVPFLKAIASRLSTVGPMTVIVAVCESAAQTNQKLAMTQQVIRRIWYEHTTDLCRQCSL
jgi:hypothetical protein